MIACNDCGHKNNEGALFCEECGQYLVPIADKTAKLVSVGQYSDGIALTPPISYSVRPSSEFSRISFVLSANGLQLTIPLMDEILIGRKDPEQAILPELDLTEYDGLACGVSRSHAKIQKHNFGIVLIDQGSTNGTNLNHEKLMPHRPYPLQSGDSISLGRLALDVFFGPKS